VCIHKIYQSLDENDLLRIECLENCVFLCAESSKRMNVTARGYVINYVIIIAEMYRLRYT
jgi:hypothetical protein